MKPASSILALESFPLQVKLQLPTNSICQTAILAGGFTLSDACWRETISKQVASYFESETGRRQRECLQEEVNSAISTESKLTAQQVCMNGQIQPSSICAEYDFGKCSKLRNCGKQCDTLDGMQCRYSTAMLTRYRPSAVYWRKRQRKLSIEQDVPFEAFGESIAVATISDLARTSGANADRFVLLAAKATETGGTMSTLGIFPSNNARFMSDIVHSIMQHSGGDMLGGVLLMSPPVELSIGDSNFMPQLNASPAFTTLESGKPNNVLVDSQVTTAQAQEKEHPSTTNSKGMSTEKNSKATKGTEKASTEKATKSKSSKGMRRRG